MQSSSRPAVYVYNSSIGCGSGHPSRGFAELFEHQLTSVLSSGTLRTASRPEAADVLFHPACLVTAFFQVRSEIRGIGSEYAARRALRAIEASVLLDIADEGHSHKPHVINALRCRHTKYEDTQPFGHPHYFPAPAFLDRAFPNLWGAKDPQRRPFATICPEAPAAVHPAAVHVPYCGPPVQTPPLRMNRSISVLFIGSEGHVWHYRSRSVSQRRGWLDALNRTRSSKAIVLQSRDGREFVGSNHTHKGRMISPNEAAYRALLADANYTVCPPGDAPDTQRIYTAVSMGSIPLLHQSFQPPQIVPWEEISAPLRVRGSGDSSTLTLPDEHMTSKLLRAVHERARAFECVPDNALMVSYLERELARIVAMPAGVDPPAVRRAVESVDRGYAECRRLIRAWSDEQRPQRSLLWELGCFGFKNMSDCECMRRTTR